MESFSIIRAFRKSLAERILISLSWMEGV